MKNGYRYSLKYGRGFTLAEVLIVIFILGVIAVLTIPTLLWEYQESSIVSRTKKASSVLDEAFVLLHGDYGQLQTWGLSADNATLEAFQKFSGALQMQEKCGTATGCLPSGCQKNISEACITSTDINADTTVAKAVLQDNMAIAMKITDRTCSTVYAGSNSPALNNVCGYIDVYFKGPKSMSKFGIDLFRFFITRENIIPAGLKGLTGDYSVAKCRTKGYGCTAWVLKNENTDYRKQAVNW